ncbi:MAG: PorP/SprF family type IX secretion system membrane protein [Phaeodactylibacter sp.]|nr:PorP/SprF family type IX secretion system membrane protein [Phaeodactylibacter sp.]MCB9296582.1 PorP/SprF family type IX secretion system membrane protein [Lewinellaceae bacterium]
MKRILYLWLLAFWVVPELYAQDIHFSQFAYSPSNINPALTGVFRGNARLIGNVRSQWRAVPVKYRTFSTSADFKIPKRFDRNGFFAAGAAFNYDDAGFSAVESRTLKLANLNLSGSYTHKLADFAFLTAGLQAGFSNRRFDLDGLYFDSQYDPATSGLDPSKNHGEDFQADNNNFADLSTGLNFRFQDYSSCEIVNDLSKRSFLDVGIGIFHLNRPDQSFGNDGDSRLFVRYSPYLFANKQVDDIVDVFGNLNFQFQGPYREWLAALGGRVYIDRTPGNQKSVALSCGYRFNRDFGDVVYPTLEVQIGEIYGSFSYDINLSDFRVATLRRGGPEIAVRYIISKVCFDNKYFCPLL